MSRLAFARSDRTEFFERLGEVGRVLKLQAVVNWSLRLLAAGLLVDCLLLLSARFLPYRLQPGALAIVPAALAVLGGVVAGFWSQSPRTIARRADRELGLKERLVTALELQRSSTGSPLIGLQLRDAVDQFRRFDPFDAFPVRLPTRELNALVVLALVAVGLVLAPNPMEQTVRQREQVAVTIKQEAERIDKLADDLAQQEDPQDFADIQDVLRAASAELQNRQLSPEEANAALQRLEQQLLSKQDPATGELEDTLASLAGSLASEPSTRDLGTSLARGDIRQAANELRRLGEQADAMSPAEKSKLARALKQAGNRASRSNSALGQALAQSSEALENGQAGEASGAMNQAADQLDRSAGQLRSAGQRERALSQLQQSRGAINRAQQQAAQGRSGAGQRGQGQQAGGENGDGMGEMGSPGAGDPESGNGDQPGGSSAGTGQGSHDEAIYDPMTSVGVPDFVPGSNGFSPDDAFQNPDPDSPYANDAQVGYKQVYAQYEEKATQTLQNSYIPAGLKDIVKDYFSSLAPNK